MKLSSKAFKHNGAIPSKYTCQGLDINPPLEIADVPAKTKSLALIMDDPDVPERIRKDRMFVHWVVFNIDPKITEIKEGVPTLGILGRNTGGMSRYMGPCPPDKEHRYYFKLYALDIMFSLSEGVSKEELLHAMEGHILAQTELIGRYEKT
jgi:Raf kinase inhibitor-like YbhB/YbcL family protein